MNFERIAIIGGGNLGVAIAEGLLEAKFVQADHLTVTRRKLQALEGLRERGVQTISDNRQAAAQADVIILAIKPKQLMDVLTEIAPVLEAKRHTLLSVVTGITSEEMREVLGKKIAIFRAMPNTAIAIRQSMTCLSADQASAEQTKFMLSLFDQLGESILIHEELMEASTVLAACGIAYAMRFIRAASQGGIEIGFNAETAQKIAAQTVKGAACLLLERGQHPEREIDRVTTPQGCTIAGLNEMEHQGFSSALIKGVVTSFKKIEKIK